MNQFIEKYKSLPNSDLVKISENPGDYQKDAVEAAHWELERRDLTNREWEDARMVLKVEEEEKSRSQKNKRELEQGIQDIFSSLLDRINPIQKDKPTDEKTIRLITLLFMIWSVYGLVVSYSEVQFYINRLLENTYFSYIYLLSLILIFWMPITTVLFGMRLKIGWVLSIMYLAFITNNRVYYILYKVGIISTDLIYIVLPAKPVITLYEIVEVLVFIAVLLVLNNKIIRQKFKITKGWVINSFVYAVLLTLLYFVLSF